MCKKARHDADVLIIEGAIEISINSRSKATVIAEDIDLSIILTEQICFKNQAREVPKIWLPCSRACGHCQGQTCPNVL